MTNHEIIGKNLAALREIRKLSQDEVAAFLGVSRPLVSYYENGQRPISLPHLEKLSDLFGVEVSDLMEESTANQQANLAFAFRTDGLSVEDLNSIGDFQKVVKNYLKMKGLDDGEKTA